MKIRSNKTGQIIEVSEADLPKYGFVKSTSQQPVAPIQQSAVSQTPQVQSDKNNGLINTVLSLLIPRTQAMGQDIQASGQTGNYVKEMQGNTNDIVANALAIREANKSGNKELASQLSQQGRNISNQTKAVAPQFSQDINKPYLERGVKTGLELGSYLVPAGKSLKTAVGLGAVSGSLKSASNDQNIVGGAVGGGVGAGVMHGLFSLGGKILGEGGNKLTLKGLRPSKSQITKFEDKTGEKLTSFVQENKLFEKGTTQVTEKLKGLYNEYDDVAIKSGKMISVDKLAKAFDDKIAELSGQSGTEINALVQKLANEKEVVLSSLGGKSEVGLDWIVKNRRILDKFIPKGAFMADPISAGSKNLVRDIYKGIIDKTTKGATKQIGTQISKFEAFKDIAKLQQNLGAGNLPVGLMSLLSAGAGGGLGYGSGGKDGAIKGALIGYGLTSAANNPKVISALSKILLSSSGKVSKTADSIILQSIGRIAGQQTSGLLENIFGGNKQDSPQTTQSSQLEENNVGQQQPQNNQLNTQPVTTNYLTGRSPEQHYQAYMRAMGAGDNKAAAKLYSLYEDETKYQDKIGGTTKKKTEKQAAYQAAADGAEYALNLLSGGGVTTGIGQGVLGKIGEKLGTNTSTQTDYRSTISAVRTSLRNAMLGANMSAQEMESLMPFIPDFNDPPEIAKQKLVSFIRESKRFSGQNVSSQQTQQFTEQ